MSIGNEGYHPTTTALILRLFGYSLPECIPNDAVLISQDVILISQHVGEEGKYRKEFEYKFKWEGENATTQYLEVRL